MFVLIYTLVLHVVLRKMIHVGFVEHNTNDGLMQIRCRIERMPHNLDLCTAPFDRQNHAVHQVSGCLGVNDWHERRQIDSPSGVACHVRLDADVFSNGTVAMQGICRSD